jgi:tetratricopeptide (TPR) repeat protein
MDTNDIHFYEDYPDVYDLDGVIHIKLSAMASTPEQRIEEVAEGLELMPPTGDPDADRHIEKALEHLNKALDPLYWIDGNHINHKDVFKELEKAVKELMKADSAELSDYIDALVAAAESIARAAINDAIAAGGDPRHINKALKHVEKALSEIAKGKFDKAIKEYEKARKEARKALNG